jgi:hypothetical protein
MSYQEAYLYALDVKSVCDELSLDHMSALKEKIDAVDDEDFLDYYSRYLTTLDRAPVTGNTYTNARMVEYSGFIRDVNATVPMGESFAIGLTVLAKTIVFVGALVVATYVAQVVVDAGLTAQMLYGAAKYAFTGNIVTYTNAVFSDKWNLFTAGPWELFDKQTNIKTDFRAENLAFGSDWYSYFKDQYPDSDVEWLTESGTNPYFNNQDTNTKTNWYVAPDGNAFSSIEEVNEYCESVYGPSWQKYFENQNTSVGNSVKIEGRGTTGRTIPNNLSEQMAMEQVKSNPLNGAFNTGIKIGDTRWSYEDG